jgi:hypothetical protein
MRGFADLAADGLIRDVGVSNCSLEQWQEAEAALGGIVLSNQVRYSLATRAPERAILPWAQANDHLVIAYSPLAQGLLSGAYGPDNRPRDVRRRNPLFLPDNLLRAGPLVECVREVAARHGATPAQVALAWLVRRPNVVVIPGARTVAQLEENVAASELPLDAADDRQLTEASDQFRPTGGKSALRRKRLQDATCRCDDGLASSRRWSRSAALGVAPRFAAGPLGRSRPTGNGPWRRTASVPRRPVFARPSTRRSPRTGPRRSGRTALLGNLENGDRPARLPHLDLDDVSRMNVLGGLHALAVQSHPAAQDCLGRRGAGLEEPRGPEPPVNADTRRHRSHALTTFLT